MDNLETMATQGTQDEDKHKNTTQKTKKITNRNRVEIMCSPRASSNIS